MRRRPGPLLSDREIEAIADGAASGACEAMPVNIPDWLFDRLAGDIRIAVRDLVILENPKPPEDEFERFEDE